MKNLIKIISLIGVIKEETVEGYRPPLNCDISRVFNSGNYDDLTKLFRTESVDGLLRELSNNPFIEKDYFLFELNDQHILRIGKLYATEYCGFQGKSDPRMIAWGFFSELIGLGFSDVVDLTSSGLESWNNNLYKERMIKSPDNSTVRLKTLGEGTLYSHRYEANFRGQYQEEAKILFERERAYQSVRR